jgi:hypothetical protein
VKAGIPPRPDLRNCSNLSTLALFSFFHGVQHSKFYLPPSVVRLACDPGHITGISTLSPLPETTFQSITHLQLLTKLPITQFWKWFGLIHVPVLSCLAVEHHLDTTLENASQKLIACITEHLPSHVQLCILLVISDHILEQPLDPSSIELSDGSIDNRVMLGMVFKAKPKYEIGYLLNLDMSFIRNSWMSSSLWAEAEGLQHKRATSGKFSLVVFLLYTHMRATHQSFQEYYNRAIAPISCLSLGAP